MYRRFAAVVQGRVPSFRASDVLSHTEHTKPTSIRIHEHTNSFANKFSYRHPLHTHTGIRALKRTQRTHVPYIRICLLALELYTTIAQQ